jgi:hypothetical protein
MNAIGDERFRFDGVREIIFQNSEVEGSLYYLQVFRR